MLQIKMLITLKCSIMQKKLITCATPFLYLTKQRSGINSSEHLKFIILYLHQILLFQVETKFSILIRLFFYNHVHKFE